MFDSSTIFQRTHAGRDEIYQKSGGLTQSERLVLIMVDGVTTAQRVRSKLPVLTDERFNRALSNLRKKEMVLEVLLPLDDQPADDVEKTVIDRFLQQDPLDPVTIISYDPEEDFGFFETPPAPHLTLVKPPEPPPQPAHFSGRAAVAFAPAAEIDEVDAFISAHKPDRTDAAEPTPAPVDVHDELPEWAEELRDTGSASEGRLDGLHLHWGYVLICVGIAFITGFVLARLTV